MTEINPELTCQSTNVPKLTPASAAGKSTLYWMTILLLLATATATDPEQPSSYTTGKDVIVLPSLGAVATRCGQVVVEHQRLMFSMVLRLNLTLPDTFKFLNSCGNALFTPTELRQLAEYVTDNAITVIPAWLQASIQQNDGRYLDEIYAPPQNARNSADRPQSKRDFNESQ